MTKGRQIFLSGAVFFLLFCMFPLIGFADGPKSSHWYPEDLLEWSPEEDPDARFNRSTVPFEKRVSDLNENHPRMVALSALNPNTSGVPSQGGKDFYANTFGFWQYVDLMVYWAGSSGEGIIVPPSADVIDASHRNGVPILGNVFFPPQVYGGQEKWVEQMLQQREDGSFPAADQLLKVAEYYGFDGWFINQETEGGDEETARKMQDFLQYLQAKKSVAMEIMWYDSMISSGEINWQNYLTDQNKMFLQDGDDRVSDSMFLNFWWSNESQQRSYEKALEIGRSPFDLYAGIDVEANGTKTNVKWENLFQEDGSAWASLGIYRPDWAFKSSETMNQFYQKEENFWTGEDETDWPGIAAYFPEKTIIDGKAFTTNFNTGSGTFFSINGERASEQSWNNRSLQDILPTWRWNVEGKGKLLEPAFDWSTAYYGGSSLKIEGERSPQNATHLKLYKTAISVEKDTELSITYKTDDKRPDMEIGLSFGQEAEAEAFLDVKKKSHGDWVTETFKLKKYEGKKLTSLSLHFDSIKNSNDYSINIGELKIYNKKEAKRAPDKPAEFMVEGTVFTDGLYANVRLSWEEIEGARHYEIYRVLSDESREFIGATPNHVYAINDMRRDGKEDESTLEVVAVSPELVRSEAVGNEFDWPEYPAPEADFRVDRTVARPGETIQFSSESTEVTEELEWQFEGGEPAVSTERNPVVRYTKEGTYSVTLTARNTSGEDVMTKKAFITITDKAGAIENVALDKIADASGACAASEGPANAIDGEVANNSKWCALGSEHWLTIDLKEEYDLSKLVVKHAEAGGESPAFNTKAFTLETSLDGEVWQEAVDVSSNSEAVTEHTISLTTARYVRLSVQEPTQTGDQAVRIYELEAYGY